jgi:gluconokinase
MVVLLMGVAGSGKTTVGKRLAQELGWPFYDGDAFHPPANVEKMSRGIPLTDAAREGWLTTLRQLIEKLQREKQSAFVACSALKHAYRDRLFSPHDDVRLIYLKADHGLLQKRLKERKGHFFTAELLTSQLETLEEPADAITLDAAKEPDALVTDIRSALGL